MKSTILLFSLLSLLFNSASAQTYYVDALSGNDAWSGTLGDPLGNNGPWKSLAKVNQSSFLPGDSIRFRCGQEWRGQIIVSSSGNATNPITYGNYGSDCASNNLPIINAAKIVQEWTGVGGNLYAAPVAYKMNQVFIDGKYLDQARYPKSGFLTIGANTTLNPSFVSNQPCSSTNVPYNYLSDSSLGLTSTQVAGADVHIRINNYIIDDFVASAYDTASGKLSIVPQFPGASCYAILKDWGYFLTNKPWMLEQSGGWAYESGQLYVRLADDSNPANHLIEISPATGEGITSPNRQYVRIDGLTIKYAGAKGINLTNPIRFTLTNLNVTDSGDTAIAVRGYATSAKDSSGNPYEGGTIEACTITNSARTGIFTDSHANISILNNRILNTGTVGRPIRSYGAIWVLTADNDVIQNNQIENSGYIGIRVQRQEGVRQNALVKNNIVENSCSVIDDCGAIYIQGHGGARVPELPTQYSKIVGNLVLNSIGNPAGRGDKRGSAQGIYLDDYTNQVEVLSNTIVNADWGIFLHNAFNNTIRENTTYHNRQNEFAISESGNYVISPKGVIHGNSVTNNIFFPLRSYSTLTHLSSFGTSDFAYYDNNLYSDMYTDILARILSADFSFTQWQLKGMDVNSTLFSPFRVQPFRISEELSGNLITNSTFDIDVSKWTAWNSVYSWQADCGIGGGCLTVSNQATSTSLATSNRFSMTEGKTYLLDFKISTTQENQKFRVVVRRYASPYESFGFDSWITAGTAWKKYTLVFTATTSIDLDARLDFQLEPGQTLNLDNVSLKEVATEYPINASNDSRIVINKQPQAQAMPCPDADSVRCSQYLDLQGDPIYWPLTLPPYSSKIAVWNSNPFADRDRDWVTDDRDTCPSSTQLADVNASGCAPADLMATIAPSRQRALLNDTLTYTITITNNGPEMANDVKLTDVIQSGLTWISTKTTQGQCSGTATIDCNLGAIPSKANATVTIDTKVVAAGTMTNRVSVSHLETEPNPSNNSATTTTNVAPRCSGGNYKITGSIRKDSKSGSRISGATVRLEASDCGQLTTTNSSGEYSFDRLKANTFLIAPSKAGCTFAPASRSIVIVNRDVTSWDKSGFSGAGAACN